jgi:hypothetical protein
MGLIRYPGVRTRGRHAVVLMLLLVVSQLATAAGFLAASGPWGKERRVTAVRPAPEAGS